MNNVNYKADGNALTIRLSGHIDSANAGAVEEAIAAARSGGAYADVTVDCDGVGTEKAVRMIVEAVARAGCQASASFPE